jgi:hypothetical protein
MAQPCPRLHPHRAIADVVHQRAPASPAQNGIFASRAANAPAKAPSSARGKRSGSLPGASAYSPLEACSCLRSKSFLERGLPRVPRLRRILKHVTEVDPPRSPEVQVCLASALGSSPSLPRTCSRSVQHNAAS